LRERGRVDSMPDSSHPTHPQPPWPYFGGTVSRDSSLPGASTRARGWACSLASSQTLVVALVLLVGLAAAFRCRGLDYGGFNEDEVAKVNAVQAYERGDFTANAEHPALMKGAMWASSAAARSWNRAAALAGLAAVPPEAALRFPNALVGAATVVPLFLLARSFFGPAVALWASLLLALNVTVTGINRIGKEDTFLVFFLLLGAWAYEEARRRHLRDGIAPHLWYAASGAAFGMMLASKYLVYYLGLWVLFGLAASAEARRAGGQAAAEASRNRQRASKWFYLAMVGAFVAANPVILLPSTWSYGLAYVTGATISHHGMSYFGRLYINQVDATPGGLPWHFYLVYVATKTPLPVLGAIALGLVELARRRHERGAVFARVFLAFYLLPASFAAGKFGRYLLPTLVLLDMVAALGAVRAFDLTARLRRPALRAVVASLVVASVIGAPVVAQIHSIPYPSMFQNAVGHAVAAPGLMFPNEELYDMGMREAVAWIAQRAAPGASIASDAPGVVGEYLRQNGRADMEARSLSMAGLAPPPVESWLLAEESHACFESAQVVAQVRGRQEPHFVHRVRGTAAVEAFRLPW